VEETNDGGREKGEGHGGVNMNEVHYNTYESNET
jgi:hypothetical protein